MKIIEPSHRIITPINGEYGRIMLRVIEEAGRRCYKSEGCITADSAGPFVQKIANVFKHESVIEHQSVTVLFICDRGVSHELVRHRIAAFSQESTRYCNYGKDKFGSEITVIRPFFLEDGTQKHEHWKLAMLACEHHYLGMLNCGASAQEARSVLPNSLKTEITMTCNLREWRHVFKMRCSSKAHPQMQQIMKPLHEEFKQHLPELFDGIEIA